MSEVDRLRDEARRRRAAATAKAARIRRTTGANVAGSEFDPRRPHNAIERYNARQLRAYINELNDFTSRSTQFVAGDRNAPLPRGEFKAFDRKQQQLRQMAEEHARQIGKFSAFGTEESVQDVRDRRHNRAQGSRRGPYSDTDYRAGDITSRRALQELDSHLRKMFSPSFMRNKVMNAREGVMKAFKMMGEAGLMEMLHSLSDFQFEVLWYDPRFAETVFAKYDAEQSRMQGNRKEQAQDRAANEQFELARDFLDWASTQVPRERPKSKPESSERIRGFKR